MAVEHSSIEWTDSTWSPIRGCSRVSAGCMRCYAERQAIRHSGPGGAYEGLVKTVGGEPRWTGAVRFVPELLDAPLRWRKPRRVFVNSMSDLFHERVERPWLDAIFGVMVRAHHERGHVFQILTKRPERMLVELKRYAAHYDAGDLSDVLDDGFNHGWDDVAGAALLVEDAWFPFKGIWLGVSVEDQATAGARIPVLMRTPAAVRWVSYEPAMAAVDFRPWLTITRERPYGLDWIVCGGESGPGARPFEVAWARATVAQCRVAGVPVFVKQLGARPVSGAEDLRGFIRDRKGASPEEWPDDLRVQEFPG